MDQQEVETHFGAIRTAANQQAEAGDFEGSCQYLDNQFSQSNLFNQPAVKGFYWRAYTTLFSNNEQHESCLEAVRKSAYYYKLAGLEYEAIKSQVVAVHSLGYLGRVEKAEQLADELIPWFDELFVGYFNIRMNLVYGYMVNGRIEKALDHLQEVRQLCLERGFENLATECLHDIGVCFDRLEQYDTALENYQLLIQEIAQAHVDDYPDWIRVKVRFNCAILLLRLGRFEEALRLLQDVRREYTLGTPSDCGFVNLAEGSIRGYLGDVELANHHFTQAIDDFVHPIDKVETYLLFSQHIRANPGGDLLQALEITHVALEILGEIDHVPFTKLILAEQAELYLALGRLDAAERVAKKAIDLVTPGKRPIQGVLLKTVLFEAILPQQPEKAADYFSEITLNDNLPIELTIRAWVGLGDAQLNLKKYTISAKAYRKALQLLQQWRRFVTGHASQAGLIQRIDKPFRGLLSSMVLMDESGKNILALLEQLRSQALAELDSESFVLQADGAVQELIDEREQLLRQLDMQIRPINRQSDDSHPVDSEQTAEREAERTIIIKAELLRVEEAIRRERPEWLQTDLNHTPAELDSISLPLDTAMLTWFQTASELHVLVMHGAEIAYFPLNYSLDQAAADWQQLFRQFARRRKGGTVNRRAADLWNHLTLPVRTTIAKAQKLLVLPIGPLWQIPFGGLVDQKLDRYVSERWEITLAPGLKIWDQCRSRATKGKNALLIGSSGDPNEDDYLPAVQAEIAFLRNEFLQPSVLIDEAVTRENLLEHLSGNQLVHIAGHIEYDPVRPVMSGIRLHNHRYFRASDFYLQPGILAGAHVVLSGCNSGKVHQSGSEIVGLTSSLIAAGARSVLVTLWPIDDQAAAQFMQFYYRNLNEGSTPSDALRKTQNEMVKSDTFNHPLDWAAFVGLFH